MRLFALALAGCLLLGCRPAGRDQIPHLRIATGGRGGLDFIPAYLASSLGFFREAGLDVTIEDLAGTAKAVESLLGGSTELVAGGYDATIEMASKGQHLKSIFLIERWPPLAIVTGTHSHKPIRTIKDLKGSAVGVSSPGSSTHRFLNYLLVKNGLTPSDIVAVGVGLNFSMTAAIEHGNVQAAVAGPLGRALVTSRSGANVMADCLSAEGSRQTLGTDNLPFIALIARSDWLNQNEATARKIGQVMSRTVNWIRGRSAEQVRDAIPQRYRGNDSPLYLTAVRDILPVFSSDGLMPADGPAHVRDFLAVSEPSLRSADIHLEETYTNKFVPAR
jgi:NitT/TauT family transport system substrate-binding protein